MSSSLRVAKKLSATALAKQSPHDPIERAMPTLPHAYPNAKRTNWADSIGCRNT
jgi:hypothetical protein